MAVRRVADVAAAGVVGVWAAFFLRSVWSPAAAVVVVLTVGAALLWRRPRVCLAVGLAAVLVAALAGIPTVGDADQWGVAMALLVGVSLGAFESARVAVGGVVLLALAVSRYTAASDVGFVDVGDVSWVACMIGGAAALAGVLTRARRRACAERARVAALAATSPQETALLAVALERERLLDDVHQILRAAISTMLAHAEAADVADPPAATVHAEAVQRVGREAITELRLVLGQLRSPAVASVPPREAPAKGRALGWRRWADRADWWLMPGAVVLAVGDLWIWRASFPRPRPSRRCCPRSSPLRR
jgi:signal transduction histidine kinase